jgi:hypothetical protein
VKWEKEIESSKQKIQMCDLRNKKVRSERKQVRDGKHVVIRGLDTILNVEFEPAYLQGTPK